MKYASLPGAETPSAEHRVLWYAKPANVWSKEALPIGNGRLGAMLFGGAAVERIQFNEISLWSGDNNWGGKYECGDHGRAADRLRARPPVPGRAAASNRCCRS